MDPEEDSRTAAVGRKRGQETDDEPVTKKPKLTTEEEVIVLDDGDASDMDSLLSNINVDVSDWERSHLNPQNVNPSSEGEAIRVNVNEPEIVDDDEANAASLPAIAKKISRQMRKKLGKSAERRVLLAARPDLSDDLQEARILLRSHFPGLISVICNTKIDGANNFFERIAILEFKDEQSARDSLSNNGQTISGHKVWLSKVPMKETDGAIAHVQLPTLNAMDQSENEDRKEPRQLVNPRIRLTNEQTKAVKDYEGRLAHQMFSSGFNQARIAEEADLGKVVQVTAVIPFQPPGTQKRMQLSSVRDAYHRHLADKAYNGLVNVWDNSKNRARGASEYTTLLLYETADNAMKAVDALRNIHCYIGQMVLDINAEVLSHLPPQPSFKKDKKSGNRLGKWKPSPKNDSASFANRRVNIVCSLIESGELSMDDYKGFSRTAESNQSTTTQAENGLNTQKPNESPEHDEMSDVDEDDPPHDQVEDPSVGQELSAAAPLPQSATQRTNTLDNIASIHSTSEEEGEILSPGEIKESPQQSPGITSHEAEGEPAVNVIDEEAGAQNVNGNDTSMYNRPTTKSHSDPTTTSHRVHLHELHPDERELQNRYFGIQDDEDIVTCTTCSKAGHMPETCPSQTCQNCGKVGVHFTDACPIMHRCERCRQIGHYKADCQELINSAFKPKVICDKCGVENVHTEDGCPLLWQTFVSSALTEVKKMTNMLMGCYNCGDYAHWGDDCPVRLGMRSRRNVDTFSAKEANIFRADPPPGRLGRLLGPPSRSKSSNPGLSIKGRAKDAEANEDDLVRRPIQQPKPRSNIKIAAPAGREYSNARPAEGPHYDRYYGPPEPRATNEQVPMGRYNTRPRSRSPPNEHERDQYARHQRRRDYDMRPADQWQPPLPNEPPPSMRGGGGAYGESYSSGSYSYNQGQSGGYQQGYQQSYQQPYQGYQNHQQPREQPRALGRGGRNNGRGLRR